jgi:ABC-type lipoprotein export system ATPase subunit|nr:ABC transporter ATP-binding protein [Candidatus Krumholzibacteria bacterium]
MKTPVLSFDNIGMQYGQAGQPTRRVLDQVSFDLPPGRNVALVGRSGSGKSTLLHLAAGVLVPSTGTVHLAGQPLSSLSEQGRTSLRSRYLGLVFQFFHLLPHLTVGENVALPGWVAGTPAAENSHRSADLLARVGLADRADDPVGKLSGGEMQRVAICRALLLKPRLVLADEPTGSLDDETGRMIMDLLLEMIAAEEGSLLFVTHSRELARAADEVWELHDGKLDRDGET